jgi:FHA domain
MIACPSCNFQNMAGAAFCVECGTILLTTDTLTLERIQPDHPAAGMAARVTMPRGPTSGDNWITLHLLESGEMLQLSASNEFTLGRVSDGQPVIPDVDLSPYQAHAQGVSRLHAVIRRGVEHVYVSDLESANGTFVNGQRLPPGEERILAHGDVIALGGLKIQVLLKTS